MTRTVLAADFGGTHLRASLVTETGEIVSRHDHPTPAVATTDQMVAAVVSLLAGAAAGGTESPLAVCIATAGLVNGHEGKVIVSPNIPGFRNLVLTKPVAEGLGIPAFLENDASAAALGEWRFGAARGCRNLIHATLGTGIGGGLVFDGRLYRGSRGFAGEIGHAIIDPSGPVCNCGSRGCLEAMVSGVAFSNRCRMLLETGKSAVLREVVGYREPTGHDLHTAAKLGDTICEAEIRHGGHLLGLAFGGLVNILNPDLITLSGGLLGMGEMLLGPMRDAMRSMAYGASSGTAVKLSELGEDAGLLGAAAVAFERLEQMAGA